MPARIDLPEKEIRRRYLSGETTSAIAESYGVSRPVISKRLKEQSVKIRSTRENSALGLYSQYDHNRSFFETIDIEEKAYWLGFIQADGCVTGNRLTISQWDQDADHLERFREAIGAGHPVRSYNGMSEITLSSPTIVDRLQVLGVVERKAHEGETVEYPDALARHYWRGVVDGDGTLSKTNRVVKLSGNEPTVREFARWIRNGSHTRRHLACLSLLALG